MVHLSQNILLYSFCDGVRGYECLCEERKWGEWRSYSVRLLIVLWKESHLLWVILGPQATTMSWLGKFNIFKPRLPQVTETIGSETVLGWGDDCRHNFHRTRRSLSMWFSLILFFFCSIWLQFGILYFIFLFMLVESHRIDLMIC